MPPKYREICLVAVMSSQLYCPFPPGGSFLHADFPNFPTTRRVKSGKQYPGVPIDVTLDLSSGPCYPEPQP